MEAKCMARGTAGAGERRVQGDRRVQTSSIRIGTVGFGDFAKIHGMRSAVPHHFLPLVIAFLPKPTVRKAQCRPFFYRW